MTDHPQRPPLVGGPLDPELLKFTDEARDPSRADWQRRLKDAGGTGAAVPLAEVDPSKELLVIVPGKGMDFRDANALAQLQNAYQIVILISDHNQPWDHGGHHIAGALEQFVDYRRAVGNAHGITPSTTLRLVGHSAGTLTAQTMLYDLVQRGLLSEREDSLFSKVRYWAIDGPWRGIDAPWIVQFLGFRYLGILAVLPPVKMDRGVQSLINRLGPLMEIATRDLGLPRSVLTTKHIFATGMQETEIRYRHFEPVSSILWEELAQGEGEDLYNFFRSHSSLDEIKRSRNELDSFSPTGMTRRKGLQNLVLVMVRDQPELIEDLRNLAESSTLDDFGRDFNDNVRRHIRTYEGQHTQFMWTNPAFLDDFRKELEDA